jgi:serine/threonine protein kinase
MVRNPRMVGSPYWMPPEIILKAPYNEKVDVWSMGVTLLQLVDKKGFDIGGPNKVDYYYCFV